MSNDDAKKVRTHPLLLPKPKKAGAVSSDDMAVPAKALGVKNQDQGQVEMSLPPPMTPATVGRRSVLDSIKYGPVNSLYWEMKKWRVPSRYPDLIRALEREQDPSRRRQMVSRHRAQIISLKRGTVRKGIDSRRSKKE